MDNILEFAMQMELDGREFYLRGARNTTSEGLKKIYQSLADEEYRHYHIFKKLNEGDLTSAVAELKSGAPSVAQTKTLFREMAESGMTSLAGDTEREIWKEARAVEEKTVALYSSEADKEDSEERRKLLNVLADEERTHVYLIENILNFLNDPEGFQDSQDYKNFMSWEGRGGSW